MDFMKRGGEGGLAGWGVLFHPSNTVRAALLPTRLFWMGNASLAAFVCEGVCMPTCMGARVCYSGIRNLFQAPQQRVAHGSYCPRSARVKSREVTDVLTIFSSQNRINLV